jgi:two-component system sensor histidine kinase RegB
MSFKEYVEEIVRSYRKISSKNFIIILDKYKYPLKSSKSPEIVYGLRNFIGNANKFSNKKIEIFLKSDKKETEIVIRDDGPGFPKDLIDKEKLGEPYIRTKNSIHVSKYGLGLGTFIGKTLLEKNYAEIMFRNLDMEKGAEVIIKWNNKDLINI